jgi:prevent-host-death family protein
MQEVSLREANQHLSHYIDEVEQGAEIIITRRGRPVARLLSIAKKRTLTATQQKAWKRLLLELQKGYHLGKGKFDRDQVHER